MSIKDDVDTNIDNYNKSELLDIVGLDSDSSEESIEERLDTIIEKYYNENNEKYAAFFISVRAKLLDLSESQEDGEEDGEDDQEQAESWYQNQYLLPTNENQLDKITNRSNNVQISNTTNPTMKRQLLGINNTIPLSVTQDTLNPVLRQTIWRHITIDSLFRPNPIPYNFSPNTPNGNETNFTVNLSESLKNVLSIQLRSIYIPATWYTYDPYKGNTSFWIQYIDSSDQPSDASWNSGDVSCCQVSITPGNYATLEDLVSEINYDISYCCNQNGCCTGTGDLSGLHLFIQNPLIENELLQFVNFTPYWVRLIFYDKNFNTNNCAKCQNIHQPETGCEKAPTYQQNLGYYLGYRILNSNETTLTSILPPIQDISGFAGSPLETLRDDYFAAINAGNDASLNIIGPEVFSQLAAISIDGFPSFPDGYWQTTTAGAVLYGTASVPPDLLGSEYLLLTLDDYTNNYPTNGLISIGPADTKLSIPSYVSKITDPSSNICDVSANDVIPPPIPPVTQYVPTFPRKLTQAELYSLNQIINNRDNPINIAVPPNPSDLFATIYTTTAAASKAIVYENSQQIYNRTYFGPVTLERLGIRLTDSTGNLVNLHGHNWSFTLAVEQLYQY